MVRLVSLFILLTLIVVLGATFYQVLAPFLMPLFLAAVLAVLCQPLFRHFIRRLNGRVRVAAAFTTTSVLAMILIPLVVGTFIGSVQLYALVQRGFENRTFHQAVAQVRNYLDIELLSGYFTVPTTSDAENTQSPSSIHSGEVNDSTQPIEAGPRAPAPEARPLDRPPQVDGVRQSPRLPADDLDPPAIVDELHTPPPGEHEIHAQLEEIRQGIRFHLLSLAERTLGALGRNSLGIAGKTVTTTVGVLTGLVTGTISFLMFVIALYYFLADGPALLESGEALIPVHAGYQRRLLNEFEKVIRAVVLATFLAAIGQALATAGALYVFGFHHFFMLFIVSCIVAIVPLAGTWLVWGPCAIWLAMQQQYVSALLLTAYGVIVVGFLDNIIRTYVLHSDAKLHPLLAFVSVLGGIQAMGLWGVFIGPIVASCLYALVQVFNLELKEFSKAHLSTDRNEGHALIQSEPAVGEISQLPFGEPSFTQPPEATGPTSATGSASGGKESARKKKRRRRR